MTTLPAYALSDDAHPERAAEWEALTARAEQAEAQLAALVEATRALLDGVGSAVVADAEVLRHGDLRASVRAALAATPATVRAHDERVRTAREIAARLRARAEREEADARVMYKRHAANNVAGWGIVAALHERAASVLRGEADAIDALPVARLPVIATCGQCHDCDPPSYDTKPDERKAYCVHPAASAPPDNPATRVDRNASPPEWCPLRRDSFESANLTTGEFNEP